MTPWLAITGWTVAHAQRPGTLRTYCGHPLRDRPTVDASSADRRCGTCERGLKGTRRHG